MKLPRRTFLHLAAGAAALPAMSRIARAQAYHADRHAGFFFNVINGFDSLTQSDLTVSVPVLVRLIGFRACTSLIANRSPFSGANPTTFAHFETYRFWFAIALQCRRTLTRSCHAVCGLK